MLMSFSKSVISPSDTSIDELAKDNIESKNKLESFIYQIKSSFGNTEVKSKLSDNENDLINSTIQSSENWLDENQNSSKEVYEEKYDEINTMLNPILMKIQSHGESSGPTNIDPTKMNMNMGGMSSEEMKQTMETMEKGPTIDEVD